MLPALAKEGFSEIRAKSVLSTFHIQRNWTDDRRKQTKHYTVYRINDGWMDEWMI